MFFIRLGIVAIANIVKKMPLMRVLLPMYSPNDLTHSLKPELITINTMS